MPPIIASPPAPVTASAMRAPCRPSGRCFQYPISRKELSEVSSQKISRSRMLSDRTMPSIAPWNSSR
jgi:hypothetical protein